MKVSEVSPLDLGKFAVLPTGKDRALAARRLINSSALKTLTCVLNEYERATGDNLTGIRRSLDAVDVLDLLDPSVHSCADIALQFMEAGHAEQVLRHLDLGAHQPLSDALAIGAYGQSVSSRHGFVRMKLADRSCLFHSGPFKLKNSRPITDSRIRELADNCATVVDTLRIHAPQLHQEYVMTTARVTFIDCEHLFGGSHRTTFGEIFVATPHGPFGDDPLGYLIEHMVHESSHNLLFALMTADQLVLNSTSEVFDAPLRKDKRPIYGIFHACFVISRMIYAFERLRGHVSLIHDDINERHFIPRLQSGVDVLEKHGAFTPMGKKMVVEMSRLAGSQ
jgi:hypothetical protein